MMPEAVDGARSMLIEMLNRLGVETVAYMTTRSVLLRYLDHTCFAS